MKRSIMIISDGTSRGTSVVDTQTGEPIHPAITKIEWRCGPGVDVAECTVTFFKVPVEITATIEDPRT